MDNIPSNGFGESTSSTLGPPPRPQTSASPEQLQVGVAGPSRTLKTRTRTGCMTCRRRKHKCGEERPNCNRCLKSGHECVWPTVDQMPKGRQPRPRKRVSSSADASASTASLTSPGVLPVNILQQQHQQQRQRQTSTATQSLDLPDNFGQWDLLAGPSSFSWPATSAAAPPPAPAAFAHDVTSPWSASQTGASTSSIGICSSSDHLEAPVPWLSADFTGGWGVHEQAALQQWDGAGPTAAESDAAWIDRLLSSSSPLRHAQTFPDLSNSSDGILEVSGLVSIDHKGQGSANHQSNARSALIPQTGCLSLCTSPTPLLEILFQDPTERSLVQHFLFQISAIFVGRASSARGTRAVPAALLDGRALDMRLLLPYFDFADFLSRPRGASLASDALGVAVMSLSASHLAHLHHVSHLHDLEAGADAATTAASAAREKQYLRASRGMAKTSMALVRTAFDLACLGTCHELRDDTAQVDEITRLLSVCALSPLIDCVTNGNSYSQSLDLAKEIVKHCGGARRMLSTVAAVIPPTKASPQAATRRRRLRLLRCSLEELLSWDLVTSLATGRCSTHFAATPSVKCSDDGDGPLQDDLVQDWLFQFAPASGSNNTDDTDWETLEQTWASSRPVADLFARVNTLCATARSESTSSITTDARMKAADVLLVEINIRQTDLLHKFPDDLAQASFLPTLIFPEAEETADYVRRVEFGKLAPIGPGQGVTDGRLADRLSFGDLNWLLLFQIILRVDVLDEDPDALHIQALATRILDLVLESHARKFVQIGLAWPMIVAGSVMLNNAGRNKALAALESFDRYFLYETYRVSDLWTEVWASRDAGGQVSWRDVAARNGGFALE